MKVPAISVVIPTRNRLDSLRRTLNSISAQTIMPGQVIIVDASDEPLISAHLPEMVGLRIIHARPSVCLQRNLGIEESESDYILLCDDDIELDTNYIEAMLGLFTQNPDAKISSGIIFEMKKGEWDYSEPAPSTVGLAFTYLFGLSLWTDVKKLKRGNFVDAFLIKYYVKKGNHLARSGWPVVTDYSQPTFTTPVYGLGAAMFPAKTLKSTGFDPLFFANGIGDNYELAMAIGAPVFVTWSAKAKHHKHLTNRVEPALSYYYRASALDHIMQKYPAFPASNRRWLAFSAMGNGLRFLAKGQLKKFSYSLKVVLRIIFNNNLYRQSN